MPTPRSQGFHHVAIRTADFDATEKFYTEVLGMSIKIAWNQKPNRAAMFDMGDGSYLEVFERPGEPAPAEPPAPALLHVALRTDDCDGFLEHIRAAGTKVTMEPKAIDIDTTAGPHPVPIRIAFFIGPNHEVFELFQNELT